MGSEEYIKKFSNEIYATKQDVSRALKTPLIDGFWTNILEYREQFFKVIKLKHIDGQSFQVCLTPEISSRINVLERKLSKIMINYSRLEANGTNRYFIYNSFKSELESIAKLYSINPTETDYKNIIGNNSSFVSSDISILKRYLDCLKDLEQNSLQDIDDNTIGNFYSYLMGTDELTSYYRTKNVQNQYSRYQIGKIYLGVPPNVIENAVDQLIVYIENSNDSLFVKAVCTFYFLYYIKPFETYSEEIAMLLFKKVLSYNELGSVVAFINFESILLDKEEIEKQFIESQKNYDLTYLLFYFLKKAEKIVDDTIDSIVNSEKMEIQKDLYQADEPIVKAEDIKEFEPEEKTPLTTEELDVKFGEEPVETPITKEEKQVNVEPILPEAKEEQTVTTIDNNLESTNSSASIEPVNNNVNDVSKDTGISTNIAIQNVPTGLSEEEAQKLETHLMEMNPDLSRGEAFFYARHCTIGMMYTVSQYQKSVMCAYETARSSMNKLVILGYYKKELLKKKFVYTPIKRG